MATRSVATVRLQTPVLWCCLAAVCLVRQADSFLSPLSPAVSGFGAESSANHRVRHRQQVNLAMSTTASREGASSSATLPSWSDLKSKADATDVGKALNREVELRKIGKGSAHVQNELRLFDSSSDPKITLFRDHAGWCVVIMV